MFHRLAFTIKERPLYHQIKLTFIFKSTREPSCCVRKASTSWLEIILTQYPFWKNDSPLTSSVPTLTLIKLSSQHHLSSPDSVPGELFFTWNEQGIQIEWMLRCCMLCSFKFTYSIFQHFFNIMLLFIVLSSRVSFR